jgi:nicotinamidase/pyrazinamidase
MRTLYLDVDTQLDFVVPSGALYVPGAERILPRVAALNREAIAQGHLLLATRDAHTEDDAEFQAWPHHCVAGALGQRKPAETIVDEMQFLDKRTVNCFDAPAMDEFLIRNRVEEAHVYGVVTEICVAHAVRGLLERNVRVVLRVDGIKELSAESRDLFLEEVRARGVRIV